MTLRSVSATQIKQHRACALQWYLQRVEGWKMPQSTSQALGEAIHKQVEDYLLEGKTPDLPSVASAIDKGLVPPTGGQYLVEEPKDYGMRLLCADVPVKGRIDLLVPPLAGGSLVKVVDWKSASSFRYVPEPDVLTRDVQGVLYLKYAFENYPFATHGQFRHVYLLTKGTGAKKVDADVVDRAFVEGQWSHIEQTVEDMKATATRSLPVVAQTQANLSHCSSYGGCSFRDRCPAASKGLVESMFEAEMASASAQSDGSSEGVTMSTLAEKLRARKAATQSIIPPDAPGGNKVPETAEGIVAPVPVVAAPVVEALVVEAPVVEAPVVEAPVVEAPVVEVPVVPVVAEAAASEELTLFIDCYPEKATFETLRALEDEIAARTPSLLAHLQKTSPKDVPEGTVDLGEVLFGRGYSALAASFALRPISGRWTVSTLGPASSKVLEVLLPKATFVVRGRR